LNEQTSAQFWLNLQSAYDLRVANDEIGGEVAALPTKLSKRRGGGSAKTKPPVCFRKRAVVSPSGGWGHFA
jgi:hypothetical protein